MIAARLTKYLGLAVGELLKTEPFSTWGVVRSVQNEPEEEIWYEFDGRGVEVTCDGMDRIQAVFLHRGEGEALAGIPFSMRRQEVLQRLGTPVKSGAAVQLPGIGDRGAWDRFTSPDGVLHIQYRVDCDEIDMVTLMRHDAVP